MWLNQPNLLNIKHKEDPLNLRISKPNALIRYSKESGLESYILKNYRYPILIPDRSAFTEWKKNETCRHYQFHHSLSTELLSEDGIVVIDCYKTIQELRSRGYQGRIVFCEPMTSCPLSNHTEFNTAISLNSSSHVENRYEIEPLYESFLSA